MQEISSYDDFPNTRFIQRLRLYHIERPHLRRWRRARHTNTLFLDKLDQWILSNFADSSITMVDCAGWYFEFHGIQTVCLESDEIAKLYWSKCHVEPDIFEHRPTYISCSDPVVFRRPWFLKYAKLDKFINFINLWTLTTTVIEFNPILIQHNHLKHRLIDLVQPMVNVQIRPIENNVWLLQP